MTLSKHRLAIVVVTAMALFVVVVAAAEARGRPFMVALSGDQEVQMGDPDGTGSARLTANVGQERLCYRLSAQDIEPATAAHVHEGTMGQAGPPVITLEPPTSGMSQGCADVDRELLLEILQDPASYYVNVHNAEYPAGALRGQLSRRAR